MLALSILDSWGGYLLQCPPGYAYVYQLPVNRLALHALTLLVGDR